MGVSVPKAPVLHMRSSSVSDTTLAAFTFAPIPSVRNSLQRVKCSSVAGHRVLDGAFLEDSGHHDRF